MPVSRRGFNRARDIGTESSNGSFAILFMATLRWCLPSVRSPLVAHHQRAAIPLEIATESPFRIVVLPIGRLVISDRMR
jgi:hypothetical protein